MGLGHVPQLTSNGRAGHRKVHSCCRWFAIELPEYDLAVMQGARRVPGHGQRIDRRDPHGDSQLGVLDQRHRLLDKGGTGMNGTALHRAAPGVQEVRGSEVTLAGLPGETRCEHTRLVGRERVLPAKFREQCARDSAARSGGTSIASTAARIISCRNST